jgi:molecular chaperone GrpE
MAEHSEVRVSEAAAERAASSPQRQGDAEVLDADVVEEPSTNGEASPTQEDAVTDAEELEGEIDELAACAAQRDSYLALAQRTQADFENYRKRVAREAGVAESRGVSRLARELLPALDNLERALTHAADADADEALMDGLRLVARELIGALERAGVTAYGEAGEQFDPELHEAVAQQPFDGLKPGEIVEIYQSGYRSAGGVIRAARVLVAG